MDGLQILNYKLNRKMGLGGPITLYSAEEVDKPENKVVAKILDKTLAHDPQIVERFKYIMPKIVELSHPNVVNVVSYAVADDYLATFSESLSGQNLQFVVLIKGLSKQAIVEIFSYILKAVEYAHEHGVIHKNLKPSNIFIPSTYKNLKVLDFCTATVLGLDNKESVIKTIFESPMFMCPEIVLGKEIDHRADIYSLGVLLYFMFSHKTPYLKTAPNNVIVENIIKKATEKDPNLRYKNCSEFLSDIEKI